MIVTMTAITTKTGPKMYTLLVSESVFKLRHQDS
jgi:hypothetical protein